MKKPVSALSSLLVLAACAGIATAPDFHHVELRVRDLSFALDRGGGDHVVPIVVKNRRSKAVHLSTCGGELLFAVERLADGVWISERGGFCLAVHEMSPIRLDPGEMHVGVGRVPAVPGRYRLLLAVYGDPEQVVREVITSAPIDVE